MLNLIVQHLLTPFPDFRLNVGQR